MLNAASRQVTVVPMTQKVTVLALILGTGRAPQPHYGRFEVAALGEVNRNFS
jgi:hypothetical protein